MVYIMQIISLIVNIYISFTEKKKRIYIATFLLNFSQLLMYYFNKDITTSFIYIVITIRSLLYIYKDNFKTNLIPYTAIVIQLLIGYFTIENTSQIISILIPCYSCWYLWFYQDTQKLRIGNIIANFAWGIYNIIGGLYIILIMRLITILSNLIAYTKRKRELLKKMAKVGKWMECN
ncbi:MAG: YgjV family protein [Clostridia bacterium]|nr:YgjV family protein [Clostridia bacterium]